MDIEEVIENSLNNRRVSEELAIEILNYGISEFLKAGCTYPQALTIIERAAEGVSRQINQNLYDPIPKDET
jgi:hypothetical protein